MGQPNPPADPGATPPADPATEPPKTDPPATGGDGLGDAGKKALDALRAELKEARAELKAVKERDPLKELLTKLGQSQDPGTDPAKALQDRIAAMERKAAEAESRALRAEVAQAKGLTAAQARRLQGSTREELEADADDLLASFPAPQGDGKVGTPRPDPSQGARGSGAPGQLTREQIQQLYRDGKYEQIDKAYAEGRIAFDKRT